MAHGASPKWGIVHTFGNLALQISRLAGMNRQGVSVR
jgi:hypothetical protein